MDHLHTVEELEAIYGTPPAHSIVKVSPRLTAAYRRWIEQSRFCVLTTVGPEGVDGSPRGDDGPVVAVLDDQTLAMPDWRGNQRLDSFRNIVRDGRASMMFFVSGSRNVIRVNGNAVITADEALRARLARKTIIPATVLVFRIAEVYSQCARSILRSKLWTMEHQSETVPTVGEMLADVSNGAIDGEAYDSEWPGRAAEAMW